MTQTFKLLEEVRIRQELPPPVVPLRERSWSTLFREGRWGSFPIFLDCVAGDFAWHAKLYHHINLNSFALQTCCNAVSKNCSYASTDAPLAHFEHVQ